MPAITVTAVNLGTDTLTATAHGLVTGDRCRVRNVGGALPAATPALTAATDYFAIRQDANNVKLADTNAHALAGTPIDITGAGSGTTTIEYGLPYCTPNAAAAAGGQIKSANDNGAWSALVALYCLLTGLAQTIWTGITLAANQHFAVSGTGKYHHDDEIVHVPLLYGSGTGWAFDTANGYMLSSAAGTWTVGIPTLVGRKLKSFTFEIWGDGAADLSGGFFIRHKAGTGAQDTAIGSTNPPASWQDVVINFTDTTIVDGDMLWINFTANAANLRLGDARVTYDFKV